MRFFVALTLLVAPVFAQTNAELKEQVRRTETAFAKTMADRDYAAFTKFLADEAIFMANGQPARGAKAVAERWKRYFDGKDAPFSSGAPSSSRCSIPARWRRRRAPSATPRESASAPSLRYGGGRRTGSGRS